VIIGTGLPTPFCKYRSSDKYFGPNLTGFQNLSGFYIDIKEQKIWIQHDGTQDSIADELVAMVYQKKTSCWLIMRHTKDNLQILPSVKILPHLAQRQ